MVEIEGRGVSVRVQIQEVDSKGAKELEWKEKGGRS